MKIWENGNKMCVFFSDRGVFPFEQRRKLMDKVKQKAKKSAISGSSLIQAGTQVNTFLVVIPP